MLSGLRISLVLPVFNEEEGLKQILPELNNMKVFDEILVVDNNSSDKSSEIARSFGTKVIPAKIQGYGSALKEGLINAQGDIIFTMEADGTFLARDIYKFFPYMDDSEIVLGTRTANSLIWHGAYMPLWVKWGNWFVAKLVEILFNGPSLTDAGCTLKMIKRHSLASIDLTLLTNESHFNAELLLAICSLKIKTVEIPVNYTPRLGESKITGGNPIRTFRLGLKMIKVIVFARLATDPSRRWKKK